MDPTTVLHKVVHGDSIENARPTKRVNRISSCMPQPSIYVTSIEPRSHEYVHIYTIGNHFVRTNRFASGICDGKAR